MSDAHDALQFGDIVTRLHHDDPAFVARMNALCRPHRRHLRTYTWLMWVMSSLILLASVWTAALLAITGVGLGVYLSCHPPRRRRTSGSE
jgi:hypothetical protein